MLYFNNKYLNLTIIHIIIIIIVRNTKIVMMLYFQSSEQWSKS